MLWGIVDSVNLQNILIDTARHRKYRDVVSLYHQTHFEIEKKPAVKKLVLLLLLTAMLGGLLFTRVDMTPYDTADFYHTTLARKDSLRLQLQSQSQTQVQEQVQAQDQAQPQAQSQSQPQDQEQVQTQSQSQPPAQVQDQTQVQPQNQVQDQSHQSQVQDQTQPDTLHTHTHAPTHTHTQFGLQAGWGIASITPAEPVRLTGKNFKPYEQVFDSVYVRTFIFDNGLNRVLLLSYDLWIMHPILAISVRQMVKQEFPQITGIYFTANHSHTSIGGWASGLLGTLVVGGNHTETIRLIVTQTRESIRQAQNALVEVEVGFGAVETDGLVANRLDENGRVDRKLRVLKFQNTHGQVAVFNTYSAHSVYMNKDINTLSADYPGPFLDILQETSPVDFASFSPGATGGHTPIGRKPFEHSRMLHYARTLASYCSDLQGKIQTENTDTLKFIEWPVELRSPHFRISNYWRFRPWVFNLVMGKTEASISVLRIGNTVLVGLPVELSGEFYPEFDAICRKRGLSLMITSFNGWYLGYANPEKYYFTLKRAETREMNWFGYQNGEYFVELVKHILEIV